MEEKKSDSYVGRLLSEDDGTRTVTALGLLIPRAEVATRSCFTTGEKALAQSSKPHTASPILLNQDRITMAYLLIDSVYSIGTPFPTSSSRNSLLLSSSAGTVVIVASRRYQCGYDNAGEVRCNEDDHDHRRWCDGDIAS
jgi:hypothetical protein